MCSAEFLFEIGSERMRLAPDFAQPRPQARAYLGGRLLCLFAPRLGLGGVGDAHPVGHSHTHDILMYESFKQYERGLREPLWYRQHYRVSGGCLHPVVKNRLVNLVLGVGIEHFLAFGNGKIYLAAHAVDVSLLAHICHGMPVMIVLCFHDAPLDICIVLYVIYQAVAFESQYRVGLSLLFLQQAAHWGRGLVGRTYRAAAFAHRLAD